MADPKPADLVLSGGGVKGIGLVGAVVALMDAGYRVQRVSGTSAGSIVGAVVALVGTSLLTSLGVAIFTIQLVGVAVLREFGILITAILLAGRSASSFVISAASGRSTRSATPISWSGPTA